MQAQVAKSNVCASGAWAAVRGLDKLSRTWLYCLFLVDEQNVQFQLLGQASANYTVGEV